MKEGEFKPTLNTFYVTKPMTAETGVYSNHKDLYDGRQEKITIGGESQEGLYLANTDISDLPYYGDGNLSELHFRFTAQTISGSQLSIPKLSIFKLADGLNVTAGEQEIDRALSLSGTVNQISLYTSHMDYDTPLLVENFDGKNKGFQDNFYVETASKRKHADTVYINAYQLYTFYSNYGVFAFDGASKGRFMKKCAAYGGVYDRVADVLPFGDTGYDDWSSVTIPLTQLDDGTWRTVPDLTVTTYIGSNLGFSGFGDDYDYAEPTYDLDTWMRNGATVWARTDWNTDNMSYTTETDAASMGRITTKNSVFTGISNTQHINGEWAKSVEDTGNSETVYAYSSLFFSEPEATDSSALFSSLWENWTPGNQEALTENAAGANPFGFTSDWSPYLQETYASIDGIPMPSYADLGNSAPDKGYKWPNYPNAIPEIELRLKINELLPTPKLNVSASTVVSGGTEIIAGSGYNNNEVYSIARSFNIFLSDQERNHYERNLLKNMHKAYWPRPISASNKSDWGPGVGFHFIKTGSDQSGYYCIPSAVFRGWKGKLDTASDLKQVINFTKGWGLVTDSKTVIPMISGGTARIGELAASGNIVSIPANEWFTMRIKLPILRRGVIGYFPDLQDTNGKMPWLKCAEYTRRKLNDIDDYTNEPTRTMMMGTFNLRPITSGGTATKEVNMPYLRDDFVSTEDIQTAFQDSQINVYVDDIKFRNFAPTVKNATKNKWNPSPKPLTIPTPVMNPSYDYITGTIGDFSLSGNGTQFLSNNYYGERNQPAPTVISVGFENFADISGAFVDKKHLAFGNFFTAQATQIPTLPDNYVTAAMSNYSNTESNRRLGLPFANNLQIWDPYVSGLAVSGAAVGNGVRLSVNQDGSLSKFTHKGLISLSSSAADFSFASPARFSNLSKTENPFVKSKVMGIDDTGMIITVNDVAPLTNHPDTDYLVWLDGLEFTNVRTRQSCKILNREGNKIYLDKSMSALLDVSGSGNYLQNWKTNNLERLWIGPYKYWLWIIMMNATNASGASWGDWNQQVPASSNVVPRKQISFGDVTITSGTGTYGSTYNESLYYDGPYANKWNLNYTEQDTSFEVTQDYGFGAAEFSNDGALVSMGGQIGDDFVYQGDNIFDLSKYIQVKSPRSGDPMNIGIVPKPASEYGTYKIRMFSASGNEAQGPPLLISGYKDKLPAINKLTTSPLVNTLSEKFDMYDLSKTDANSVLFKWEEGESDDIIYRQLIVDNRSILDKYHRAIAYWPMNENSDAKWGYNYSGNSTTKYIMNNANVGTTDIAAWRTLGGFCGWGTVFQNGSTQVGYLSGSQAISGTSYLDEWTVMFHAKPGGNYDGVTWASGSQTDCNPYYHYGVMGINLQNPRANKSRPYVWVNAVPTAADGSIAGPLTTYLRSKTAVDWDGQQPLFVAVTFNKRLPRDNMKLYVNGRLEDTSGTDWVQNTVVGASGTTMRKKPLMGLNMHGLLEEIIVYEKEMYFPPEPNEFILDTTWLPDVSGASSSNPENVYQARLFAIDHHNIRGNSPREVARTNTAQWKVTGL